MGRTLAVPPHDPKTVKPRVNQNNLALYTCS